MCVCVCVCVSVCNAAEDMHRAVGGHTEARENGQG